MKNELPKLIETYVKASNENDFEKFISCFSESATVQDEGETLQGYKQINGWFKKSRAKYNFKAEPLKIDEANDKLIMTAKVTGSFPGSPINLKYHFQLDSGMIQDLKITT